MKDLDKLALVPEGPPSGSAERRKRLVAEQLTAIERSVSDGFRAAARVLSFREYLELFASHPWRYGRNAAHYVRDMFDHFGSDEVKRPWGAETRFRLFDAPWEEISAPGREPNLVGQEEIQAEIYRSICNFAREGRANRLVLMHGPNGSAKSRAAACILRALEHYSKLDEGPLYRFHWIFPSRKTSRGSIGFGGEEVAQELDSYAHLEEGDIDARLVIELRDHPLFLMPLELRRPLLDQLLADAMPGLLRPEWLYTGELSHKNKQIFEALLSSYEGDLREVLRHVQVERYYISRRYRVGAVTIGPEMSVDASERQVTADRSLSALPTSLQATTLFEAHGELVEAAGGVLEFSDLLKRPIDTFRYLQLSLETGQVSLSQQTIDTNVVMIGSANEVHLAAFREHPEYPSFRGRIETIRVPYLRSYLDEERIYTQQIVPQLRRHVAPQAVRISAEFAVLTRMRRPDPKRYPKALAAILDGLTAVEKMELYATGEAPARLSNEERKVLRANIGVVYRETASDLDYEGRVGVSPREMRTLLLDAAQSDEFVGLSPFAVLKELDELCKRSSEFEWLKLKPLSGGYHDHESFRTEVRRRLFDRVEGDLRVASGLVDPKQYGELFGRYIDHVSVWVKGEKVRNPVTGKDQDPDEKLMREVEGLLGVEGDHKEHRHTVISMIAAWAIDHPGERPRHDEIFPGHVDQLQDTAFRRLRKPFAVVLRDVVVLGKHRDGAPRPSQPRDGGLDDERRRRARETIDRMIERGYIEESAVEAASALLRERFADVV